MKQVSLLSMVLAAACASVPQPAAPPVTVVVSAERAADAHDAALLRGLTEASLRTFAPHARPATVTISLTAPVAITQPSVRLDSAATSLGWDAFPAVGSVPVVFKHPAGDRSNVVVVGLHVGSYTIADANGKIVESMPIDWMLTIGRVPRLQALRATADAIAGRVALSGS